jgi:ferredoxin
MTQSSYGLLRFTSCFPIVTGHPKLAPELQRSRHMAYVITDSCTKDELCVQACPVDCIHPKQDEAGFADVPQLYVNPTDCIDCGACVPVCPANAVFALDDVPADKAEFTEVNAKYYN